MWDERPVGTHFNQPTLIAARWAGAGSSAPTPVANVKDAQATKTTITLNSTGNITVQFLDTPMGIFQSYDFWVASNNAADKNVRVTPPTVGSYAFQLNVTYMANGSAVNIAVGEELVCECWLARTQVP